MPKNRDELKDLSESSSSSEEICGEKQAKVRKCFEGLITVLEECSEPEEKYAPQFLFDALDSVFDYFCSNDYENLNS